MKFVSAVSSAMTSRDINWDDVPQARRDELEARRTSLLEPFLCRDIYIYILYAFWPW